MEGSGSTWRPATGSETSRTQLWGHPVPAAESEMVQGPIQGPLGRKTSKKNKSMCDCCREDDDEEKKKLELLTQGIRCTKL